MRRYTLYICMLAMSLLSLSCIREDGKDVQKGPAILFSASDPQTKAFIDEINRSGNELVVYDYMFGTEGTLNSVGEQRWYIDHARIRCTVDGQQTWDFVSGDEYFWLYGSHHNCFGWLFMGPSGNNTITFFGEHPEFNKETFILDLPAYEFTLQSPVYDFLYSDIVERSYTQANPDSSPIDLKMNHLFSAFRFKARNVRQSDVTVLGASLTLVTQKKVDIDFSKAKEDGVIDNKPVVAYTETATGVFELSRGEGGDRLVSTPVTSVDADPGYSVINLFDLSDPDAYKMVWPQNATEFEEAQLEVRFIDSAKNTEETKIFTLSGFTPQEWLSGNRYSYELVFADQEIRLTCTVEPWRRKEIPLKYTDVVIVSDKIQWHDNTISNLNEHTGEVLLFNDTAKPAECYFKIDEPSGTWHASLIPVGGTNTGAFCFVNPANPAEVLNDPSGPVGEIGRLMIRVTDATSQTNVNKAKLRIVVKTGAGLDEADKQTIVVENLCSGHDYNEYTLVQNLII